MLQVSGPLLTLIGQVLRARTLNVPMRRPIMRIVLAPVVAPAVYLTGLGVLLLLAGFAFALVVSPHRVFAVVARPPERVRPE